MNALAFQVAFTLSLVLPLMIGIAALQPAWFYPAFMIALGAHYLPFVFLYGMWQFAGMFATLVAAGVVIARIPPTPLSVGAWFTAAVLLAFAFLSRHVARNARDY